MNQNTAFIYSYNAKDSKEIESIRKKYLPQEENKLDELRRLDKLVSDSGITQALIVGIIGALIFGIGLCLAMEVFAGGIIMQIFGAIVGIIGMGVMFMAYPVYRKVYNNTKEKYAPRILVLTKELSDNN